jgi:hypothetical protein
MVVEQAEERRSLTPARLLAGSLIGGAGIALLGFLFGGASASAAEPAPSEPLTHSALSSVGSLVSEVAGAVSGTVGQVAEPAAAAVRPVAAVAPAPVRQAVSTVTTPVTDAVQDGAAASPVTVVVSPVTTAVDGILNGIPFAHDVLGEAPVGTVVIPVAEAVDITVGEVVGAAMDAVHVIAGPAPGDVESVVAGVLAGLGLAAAAGGISGVLAGLTDRRSTLLGALHAHPVAGSLGSLRGTPAAPRGSTPFDQPAISGSGASASWSGAAGPAAGVFIDFFALLAGARAALSTSADDRLPASAVADHDTSPD